MENICILQWDEEKFLRSKDEWNELLSRSNADALFLSWEWQATWWKVFSDPENMTLHIFAATASDGKLIGLAPLYSSTVTTKKIKTNRLQFIGNCWRGKATMLTELLDFIVDKSNSKNITRDLCVDIFSQEHWDEFILPYLSLQSETYQSLIENKLYSKCYFRHAEKYNSYYLNTQGEFKKYTENLGKNTRLKLINRRALFEKLGNTTYERMLSDNIDDKFDLLNNLHSKRWTKPVFDGDRLLFNSTIAKLMAKKNCLNFSTLSIDNEPVSIQYNYVVNQHNYNIQAGFDEEFHNKISLGYLHFGYEIEASFHEKINVYDFLAGEGKNTQYKERLTNSYLGMVDLQIIRNPILKTLYRLYDFFKYK